MHPCNRKPNGSVCHSHLYVKHSLGLRCNIFSASIFLIFFLIFHLDRTIKQRSEHSDVGLLSLSFVSEPKISCMQCWIRYSLILPLQQLLMLHHKFEFSPSKQVKFLPKPFQDCLKKGQHIGLPPQKRFECDLKTFHFQLCQTMLF